MDVHFVYAGNYYFKPEIISFRLNSLIQKVIKKHKIKRAMVTKIYMGKSHLITKEKMDMYTNYEQKTIESVNDDLDSLFENIRLGKAQNEKFRTYFFPKLTKEELKLVERKDEIFMETFETKMHADVDKVEMAASESNSKFVWVDCKRTTFTIQNSFNLAWDIFSNHRTGRPEVFFSRHHAQS